MLTEDVLATPLSSTARIAVWRIVWVTTLCRFNSHTEEGWSWLLLRS